jgi:hypothetical protein
VPQSYIGPGAMRFVKDHVRNALRFPLFTLFAEKVGAIRRD